MARFQTDEEARRLGEALAALRRARGLSQAEAGERLGMTSQGWGLYEAGKRPGLFRPDVQRRMTAALGATPEALRAAADGEDVAIEAAPPGLRSEGPAFAGAPAAARRRLRVPTDDLAPWASAGVIVEYAPGQWPRRGQGCVVETPDGQRRVRIYERTDGEVLVLRGGPGGLQTEERLPDAAGLRVSAVVARLEPQ